ncbi:MAG: SIS domain-containing protein [Bacilli bacterium]|nr:SIS domain-containing protein [Bacilli bacterium]
MDFKKAIKEYYEREIRVINNLNLDELNEAMNAIYTTYKNNGTIYVCGNGGSASTASHMQNDFNKGISEYTDLKFNFYCLNDNVSTMMAVANDIGYDEVFRFPLLNKITENDLLIGISGSGNSKNVLNAAEYAKEVGAKVLGMTGYTGGKLREMADYIMHVDEMDMQIAEDIHMTFDHMMMKIFYNFLTKGEITGNNIADVHC